EPSRSGTETGRESGGSPKYGFRAFPESTPFLNPGDSEKAQDSTELPHGFGDCRNPTRTNKLSDGHGFEPIEVVLQFARFPAPGKGVAVNSFVVRPERGRYSKHFLELQCSVGGNHRLASDDFVDRFERAAHSLRQLRLSHAE